jgi:hypothetical protein
VYEYEYEYVNDYGITQAKPESIDSFDLRLLRKVGTAFQAVRCFAARPEVIALPLLGLPGSNVRATVCGA